jgi:hypothetical protein
MLHLLLPLLALDESTALEQRFRDEDTTRIGPVSSLGADGGDHGGMRSFLERLTRRARRDAMHSLLRSPLSSETHR